MLAQALPEADVALREERDAYRFYRIHIPYGDIARYLARMAQPGDALLLVGPDQQESLARFYDGDLPIYELPQQPPDRDATLSQLEQMAGQQRRLHVLYRASEGSDPEGIVQGWLAEHAYPGRDTWLGPVRAVTTILPGGEAGWSTEQPAAAFGGQLELVETARSAQTVQAGEPLALRLAWQTIAQPSADYALFLQLLDADGRVAAQRDVPLLAGGVPASAWQPGQQAETRLGIALPVGSAPGDYRLIAGLYDPQTGQRVPVGGGDFVELGVVSVLPSAPGAVDLTAQRFRPNHAFGEVTLEGFQRSKQGYDYAPDTPLAPGDVLDLIFIWRAAQQPTTDWALTARLLDGDGQPVASVTAPLAGARNPASQWRAGELARGQHSLALPPDLPPGRYQVQVAVHRPDDDAPTDWLHLGKLQVTP